MKAFLVRLGACLLTVLPAVASAQPAGAFGRGDSEMNAALAVLSRDARFAHDPFSAPFPSAAARELSRAEDDFKLALKEEADPVVRDTIQLRLAELAYDERRWPQAKKGFEAVLTSKEKSYARPLALVGLACDYAAMGNIPETAKALRVLEKDFPEYLKDPLVVFLRGAVALHQGRYADAERLLEGQDTPQARYFLGKDYLAWNKPLLAAAVFKALEDGGPPPNLREPSRFFLGDSFLLSQDYEGATSQYNSLLSAFPSTAYEAAARYRIAAAAFEKGAYGQAVEGFQSVLSKTDDRFYRPLAQFFIGESYLAAGRPKEALAAFGRQGKDDPQLFELAELRQAWILKTMGDSSGSARAFTRLVRQHPRSALAAQAYLVLGNLMEENKRHQDALSDYERVLDIAPKSDSAEQALFLMLELQYRLKNYSFILTSYQYLLQQLAPAPTKWKSFSYLIVADTDLRQGRMAEARQIYELLLSSYTNEAVTVYAQDGLAWCDELLGRDKQAVIDRQKVRTTIQLAASTSTLADLNDLGLADSFYAQKDFSDAYDFYTKFAGEHPGLPAVPMALYRAGDALYHERYYTEAVNVWEKLVSVSSGAPEAQKASARIADTLFRGGRYQQAQDAYEKLSLASGQGAEQAAFDELRLAQSAYYLKDPKQALSLVKSLAAAHPASSEVSEALDLAENVFDAPGQGDFAAFLREIITSAPGTAAAAQARFRLGRWLFDGKKYAEAAPELERFSVEFPSDAQLPQAQLLLGESYLVRNDFAKAAPVFERFALSYPKTPEAPRALLDLGNCYYNLKKYDDVARAYGKLVDDYPDSPVAQSARFNLALSYTDSGDLVKALSAYRAYLDAPGKHDQQLPALWSIFDLQRRQAQYIDAIGTLKRLYAGARGHDRLEAAFRLGETELTIGEVPQALRAWEGAARLKPEGDPFRLQALIELSKLYEKDGKTRKAAACYRDLAAHSPDKSVASAARARLQELEGRAQEAAK